MKTYTLFLISYLVMFVTTNNLTTNKNDFLFKQQMFYPSDFLNSNHNLENETKGLLRNIGL